MAKITQRGRKELKRAYEIANEGEHNDLHVYVELEDGSEAILEILGQGDVYVEHPDNYSSDVINVNEITLHKFHNRVVEIIEQ